MQVDRRVNKKAKILTARYTWNGHWILENLNRGKPRGSMRTVPMYNSSRKTGIQSALKKLHIFKEKAYFLPLASNYSL